MPLIACASAVALAAAVFGFSWLRSDGRAGPAKVSAQPLEPSSAEASVVLRDKASAAFGVPLPNVAAPDGWILVSEKLQSFTMDNKRTPDDSGPFKIYRRTWMPIGANQKDPAVLWAQLRVSPPPPLDTRTPADAASTFDLGGGVTAYGFSAVGGIGNTGVSTQLSYLEWQRAGLRYGLQAVGLPTAEVVQLAAAATPR